MKQKIRQVRLRGRRLARVWHKKYHYHPYLLPILIFLAIFSLSIFLFILIHSQPVVATDAHTIILWHDKKSETLPTRSKTVGEFLQKLDVTLNEGDVVEPALDTEILEDNFHVNVYRALPVQIDDNGHKTFALSAAPTPRSVAKQVGIEVYPEDYITSAPADNFLGGSIGQQITITRATPANLNLYGTPLALRTHAKTVGDLLKEKNVKLAADDSVQPGLDTPLTPQTLIFVTRSGQQVQTVEETIAMPVQTVQDNSLSFGTTALRQKGSPGKKSVTYQIDLKNGKEIGRRIIQEVVTVQPVAQIVARGQAVAIPTDKEAIMSAAGIASSDYPYVYYIINHENALWCATRWQGQTTCPAFYAEKFPGAESSATTGYGLCQSTPANKMATAGADWRTNPVTQMKWCNSYAVRRFGSWAAAYNYWIAHGNW